MALKASTWIGQARTCAAACGISHTTPLHDCGCHLHAQAFNVSVKASQSSSFIGGPGAAAGQGHQSPHQRRPAPIRPPPLAALSRQTSMAASTAGILILARPRWESLWLISRFHLYRLLGPMHSLCNAALTMNCTRCFDVSKRHTEDISCAQHRRTGSAQHNGGLTPVASVKDLASASQLAFAQGGAHSSPSQQVQSLASQLNLSSNCLYTAAPQHTTQHTAFSSACLDCCTVRVVLSAQSWRRPLEARGRLRGPGRGARLQGRDPVLGTATGGPPSSGPSSIRSMFTGLSGFLGSSLAPVKVLHKPLLLLLSMVLI